MSNPKAIVESFQANSYYPPILMANCHFQTIIGSGAIINKYLGHMSRPFETTEVRIETKDGDFFDVEFTSGYETSETLVVIVHGLESGKHSSLVTRMALGFMSKGFACCLFSFRACNGVENRTPKAYHVGFTEDLHYLTTLIHQRHPSQLIYLSGFSLGGNVILKMLGELGERAKDLNLAGCAVTCVPFDPIGAQNKLDVGFNRIAYSMTFLETLKQKAEAHAKRFPGMFDVEAVRRCQTIGDYDDLFVAPVYGFKDKLDYYRQCGAKWWLCKIRVPSVAINARDDPFIDEATLPTAEDVGPEAPVRLIYTQHGGHCGFHTWLSGSADDSESESVKPHGWIAEELARAISHIHKHRSS